MPSKVESLDLDRYDRQILELLQQHGRISNQELADRIGLSPSPCLRRVKALEESGLIQGYRALVDAKRMGLTWWLYCIYRWIDTRLSGSRTLSEKSNACPKCWNV